MVASPRTMSGAAGVDVGSSEAISDPAALHGHSLSTVGRTAACLGALWSDHTGVICSCSFVQLRLHQQSLETPSSVGGVDAGWAAAPSGISRPRYQMLACICWSLPQPAVFRAPSRSLLVYRGPQAARLRRPESQSTTDIMDLCCLGIDVLVRSSCWQHRSK